MWVMTSSRTSRGHEIYIGAVLIARITFWGYPQVVMSTLDGYDIFPNMSEAYKALHSKLNSEPKDDRTSPDT